MTRELRLLMRGKRPFPLRRWLVGTVVVAVLLAALAAYVLSLPQFGGKLEGERLVRAQANALYRDGSFANPLPPASYQAADVWALIQGQFFGDEVRAPRAAVPVLAVAPETLKAGAQSSMTISTTAPATATATATAPTPAPAPSLRAFWIGHASVYIEIDGLRLLVDPMFSEYASPFPYGPRRLHPTPIALAELPPIDAVLVTHDHYDHLDMPSVQHLAGRGTTFFVPLGIGAHLQAWGVPAAQVREMAWWQEHSLRGVRIVSTPARHYSGRALTDRNATLWTSWSVVGTRHRFFVSGDTGYSDHFRSIGERLGPFDLSFVKIGAYGPGAPWLDIHMSAEDAVRAHQDVRARRMFPVHWGTFNLAFHDWAEPIERALAAARASKVDLLTPRVGEWVDADAAFAGSAWWSSVK